MDQLRSREGKGLSGRLVGSTEETEVVEDENTLGGGSNFVSVKEGGILAFFFIFLFFRLREGSGVKVKVVRRR